MLENLRFNPAETGVRKSQKPNGDIAKYKSTPQEVQKFRAHLSSLGDIYINDAFGVSHRAHSSVVGIDLETRAAGMLM